MAGKDTSKTQLQVDPYSKKTLLNVRNEDLRKERGDSKGVTSFEYKNEWRKRLFPSHLDDGRECMMICSGGDCFIPSIDVIPKLRAKSMVDSELQLLRKELDVMQEKMKCDERIRLVHVCSDFPGAQTSKDYYLEKMKQLMMECKQPGAVIWYTGHGERGTGNWCFKDGVVTFEDIFALYLDHFRGKVLTLVCDCSYSGSWMVWCAKKLDEIGIPSCGHHTREQGILIKVYSSCRDDQQASLLAFCEEAVVVNEKKKIWYWTKQLTSGQKSRTNAFTDIQCRKKPEEACEILPHHTWMDRLFNAPYVHLMRGNDKGRPAWHYVLVDKEKEEEFKAQLKTGTIDVAKFGKILHSGWGEDPPKEKRKEVADRFTEYLEPE